MNPKAIYVLDCDAYDMVFGRPEREALQTQLGFAPPQFTRVGLASHPEVLADVEMIFSGWGGPKIDAAFLERAPKLKVVFYAAGAVGGIITPEAWRRNVVITSAYAANAVPVAEFCLATILYSLKQGWTLSRRMHANQDFPRRDDAPGCFGTTVGLVSMGMIARTLLKFLKPFDLHVVAYDPFLSPSEAADLGIELVSLEQVFTRSDVVSLHTPYLPETAGLITGKMLDSMKPGSTFINTARGQVVREKEMLSVAQRRPDVQFVLDVLTQEPPVKGSPFYTLPNVVLTPHIAGSVGQECRRMAIAMVDELKRHLAGEPLKWAVTPDLAARSSHRPVAVNPAQLLSPIPA